MANFTLWNRLSRVNGGTNLLAGDNSDLVDTSQGLTQLSALKDVTSTGAGKVTYGTGALVTGTLAVVTGLTTVLGFTCSPVTQPTGTGVASDQILVPTWATGTVTVTAYSISSVTGATIAASGSTGSFSWIAVGT